MKKIPFAILFCSLFAIQACDEDQNQPIVPTISCPELESYLACPQCPTCKEDGQCPVVTCPECKENGQCPIVTCPECKENDQCPIVTCPECKENDQCPIVTCPECKENDQCPACNADQINAQLTTCSTDLTTTKQELSTTKQQLENQQASNTACNGYLNNCYTDLSECQDNKCPACNTDELNSQLSSCNNSLSSTKQELEIQKKSNEVCSDDLDNCNANLSDLLAKPKSQSGSRLIFKEHKMSDGSIYVDPYPYDTKLGSTCTFYNNLGNEEGLYCCISIDVTNQANPLNNYPSLFIDSNCTQSVDQLDKRNYVLTSSTCKPNELIGKHLFVYTISTTFSCNSTNSYYNYYVFTVSDVVTKELYTGTPSYCSKYSNGYTLVKGHYSTPEEIKSYYVCED